MAAALTAIGFTFAPWVIVSDSCLLQCPPTGGVRHGIGYVGMFGLPVLVATILLLLLMAKRAQRPAIAAALLAVASLPGLIATLNGPFSQVLSIEWGLWGVFASLGLGFVSLLVAAFRAKTTTATRS